MNAYTGPIAHQVWPEARAAGWIGHLDRVDPDGVVEGWCWRPDTKAARASIVVQVDGIPMASARCDGMRPDLLARGIGDGAYGFLVVLPDAALRPGQSASVTLHDAETGRALDGPQTLSAPPAQRATPLSSPTAKIEGNLDGVSSEGIVTGWCWHPMQPTSPVSVTITVDSHVIGTARADTMRPDLLRAGIGHGAYGFSFALPWALLEASGIITVAAADAATGQGFGVPCVANPGRLSATHERIADLQHEFRRLTADLAAITATIAQREATGPVQSLFATLGAVFTNLAGEQAAPALDKSRALQPQPSDIAALPGQVLRLAIAAAPRATIIVFATADLQVLTDCLQSLHNRGIDEHADVIVMSAKGTYDDIATLHATIGNLHLVENRSTHLADALVRLSRPATPIIVLAPIVRPDCIWLDQLIITASGHPEAGIVGGRVIADHDGLLRHCALDIDQHGLPVATGAFEPADNPPHRHLRRVEAVGGMGFLVSAHAIDNLRRQPACLHAPSGPGDDALDICLRVSHSGLDILVQPAASATCSDAADLSPYVPDLRGAPQQHHAAWAARPAFRNHAAKFLLIAKSLPPEPDSAIVVRLTALRALGADITFAVTKPIPLPLPSTLWVEARGACVLDPSSGGSIGATLQSIGHTIDLVEFLSDNPPDGLVQRVRALVPRAMILGVQPHLSHQPLSRHDRTRLSFLIKQHPSPNTFHGRQGLALVADFTDPVLQKSLLWLVSDILPALHVTHPEISLHVIAIGHSKPIAAKIMGPPNSNLRLDRLSSTSLQGLRTRRLAVIPSRATTQTEALAGRNFETKTGFWSHTKAEAALCLAAGLPLIGMQLAPLPEQPSETDAVAAATTEHFIRTIIALHENAVEWTRHSAAAITLCRSEFTPQAASSLYRNFVEHGINS